ncbi:Hypothetical predicted protein [Cloeon dipterum]|uniref:Neuropeptide F n=1 Tax=Cloeon dipterum TaxID=197152 RepID=A0A8S1C5H0_9INSE|nr:Hypothetical predicted protein [Cloeon dipterum]
MSPRGQLALCVPLAVLWLVLAQAGHSARAQQDPMQTSTMGGASRYLRDLDKYYTQVARPSTRSDPLTYEDDDVEYIKASQALRMMKLNELNRFYKARSRPRFGKRTEFHLNSQERDIAGVRRNGGVSVAYKNR